LLGRQSVTSKGDNDWLTWDIEGEGEEEKEDTLHAFFLFVWMNAKQALTSSFCRIIKTLLSPTFLKGKRVGWSCVWCV
jgi:hypothetical protein